MKIYISQYHDCIGYCLLGDKDQEYTSGAINASAKLEKSYLAAVEKTLFFILANKPLYANTDPQIITDFKKDELNNRLNLEIENSPLVNKYKRTKNVNFSIKHISEKTDIDSYYLTYTTNQAKFFKMRNNNIQKGR